MLNKQKILETAKKKGQIRTSDFSSDFEVSRQYASTLIKQLVLSEQLIKIHYALKGALENENIKINHFYGEDEIPIYEPHTTLAYYENDDNNSYALPDLNVSWLVDRIEMWGNMSPILFRLEN